MQKKKAKIKPKKKAKKSARKALNEAILKSKIRAGTESKIVKKSVCTTDILISAINLSKYGFVKKPVYRRIGNFILDSANFQIVLVKCTNNKDYNVEFFDKTTEEDGIFIKTISKEKELIELLKAILNNKIIV
jgi:hypothetical protein